ARPAEPGPDRHRPRHRTADDQSERLEPRRHSARRARHAVLVLGPPEGETPMPFSLGPAEMVFIMVVLLLIFGAKRLPELGSGLGKGIREFRSSMRDIKGEIERDDT